jgi:hypothetical protein
MDEDQGKQPEPQPQPKPQESQGGGLGTQNDNFGLDRGTGKIPQDYKSGWEKKETKIIIVPPPGTDQ